MTVPVTSTGMNQLTLTVGAGSPIPPNRVTVSGAFLAADNREFSTDPDKGGSDTARLNSLLRRNYGTVAGAHARNASEAVAALGVG